MEESIWTISVLEHALLVSPEILTFTVTDEEALDAAIIADNKSRIFQNPRGWSSSSVLLCLLQISDVPSLSPRVRDLFIKGVLT